MKISFSKYIDLTNINPKAKESEIKKTCQEAKKFNFRGVCVRPKWTSLVKKELKGTDIKTVVLIDDPIGDSPYREKIKICKMVKRWGADEIDVVISLPDVKHEKWNKILKELKEICKILPAKIIIGSGYLTDIEIETVSKIVKKSGAICIKMATVKDPLENRELEEKVRHLKLMKKFAPGILIKASGNILKLSDLKLMIKSGADIVGTSRGVEMMEEIKQIEKEKK